MCENLCEYWYLYVHYAILLVTQEEEGEFLWVTAGSIHWDRDGEIHEWVTTWRANKDTSGGKSNPRVKQTNISPCESRRRRVTSCCCKTPYHAHPPVVSFPFGEDCELQSDSSVCQEKGWETDSAAVVAVTGVGVCMCVTFGAAVSRFSSRQNLF